MFFDYQQDKVDDGIQDSVPSPHKTGSGIGVKIVIAGLALSIATIVVGTVAMAALGIDGFVSSVRTSDRNDAESTYEPKTPGTREPNSTKTLDPDPSKPAKGDKDPGGPYDVPKAEAPKPKPKDSNAGPKPPKERRPAPTPTDEAERSYPDEPPSSDHDTPKCPAPDPGESGEC